MSVIYASIKRCKFNTIL